MVYPRPERTPGAYLALGIAVHSTFQQWEMIERRLSKSQLLELYEEHYDVEINKLKEEQPDLTKWTLPGITKTAEASIASYRKRGLTKDVPLYYDRCVEAEWEVLRLPSGELALELPFEIEFTWRDREIILRGHVDKVQWWPHKKMVALEDLKTGSADDDDSDPRQLAAYVVGLAECYQIDINYGRYWFSKLDRPSGWFDLSRWNILTVADQYGMMDFAIDNGIFLPKPGKQCGMCGVREVCSVNGVG